MNNNVVLRNGYAPNPYDVVLYDGSITPPIPVVSGSVSYLLMFPSFGTAVQDLVLSHYYSPSRNINVGCCANMWVYNLLNGTIDPRWGIFITLPAPIIAELYFHPNLELLANSPHSLAHRSIILKNDLDLPATDYQFLVNALGVFPLRLN